MTIQELRDEIVVDIGADSSDSTLLANIFSWIKQGLRRIPLFTRDRLLLTTEYATLTAGNNKITLPAGFLEERQIYFIRSGNRIVLKRDNYDTYSDNFSSNASGDPSSYNISANVVRFNRNASSNIVIYVEFFEEVDGVSLTDTFFGSQDMAELVKDFAKYYYFMYEEDIAKANHYLGLTTSSLEALERRYLKQEIPDYVEER